MGEIESTLRFTKEIEALLENRYGATGRGLHEKLSSVENKIPKSSFQSMRRIATIRNKVAHEHGYSIDDPRGFAKACEEAIRFLKSQPPTARGPNAAGSWEVSVRLFLQSLQMWAAGLLAACGGMAGLVTTGLGAGILGALVGAVLGALLLSNQAIEFYVQAAYVVFGIVMLVFLAGVISSLWSVGHSPLPKTVPSTGTKGTGSTQISHPEDRRATKAT